MDLYVLAFVRRKGSHLTVLLQSYLNEHYSQRVHIYTDGSATATTAGSGVYIESINKRYAITLTQTTSSFSSKCMPFHALYCLFTYKFMKALILTDSLGALQAISTGIWKKHSFMNKIFFKFQPSYTVI